MTMAFVDHHFGSQFQNITIVHIPMPMSIQPSTSIVAFFIIISAC